MNKRTTRRLSSRVSVDILWETVGDDLKEKPAIQVNIPGTFEETGGPVLTKREAWVLAKTLKHFAKHGRLPKETRPRCPECGLILSATAGHINSDLTAACATFLPSTESAQAFRAWYYDLPAGQECLCRCPCEEE